mgnify:CR=1 FL=1
MVNLPNGKFKRIKRACVKTPELTSSTKKAQLRGRELNGHHFQNLDINFEISNFEKSFIKPEKVQEQSYLRIKQTTALIDNRIY